MLARGVQALFFFNCRFSHNGFVMVEPSIDLVYTCLALDKTIIPAEGEIHKYLTVTSLTNLYV